MSKCPLLTTFEEEVECFKECELYKWSEIKIKCPFAELKNFKKKTLTIKKYMSMIYLKMIKLRL